MPTQTDDLRIKKYTRLISPREMKAEIPVSEAACRTVVGGREAIERILRKEDARLLALMLESYLGEGNQKFTGNPADLAYGVSITDECISWETTEKLILWAAEKVAALN